MHQPKSPKKPSPPGRGLGEGPAQKHPTQTAKTPKKPAPPTERQDENLPRNNNLNAIRLLAALTVLASHAYVLTGHPNEEPLAILFSHSIDGGALAVAVFFILSGTLIARSAQRHPPRAFIAARVRRILPAYIAVILLQTFALGPAFTTLPLPTYLATPALWSGLARSLAFSPPPSLPGVFETNPLPGLVNASLWTLRIEILCYAATLALARLGTLRPNQILLPLAILWAALLAILAARAGHAPAALADIRIAAITDCALHFTMGVAAWVYRDTMKPSPALAGAGALTILILAPTPLAPIAWHACLPIIVLTLGLARPIAAPLMTRLGDISYGTYLYAFPIAQTLLAYLPLTPLQLIALATPPTLLCAALSRRLIEQRYTPKLGKYT